MRALAGALARRLSNSGSYISLCAMIIVIAVWSIGFGFSYVDMIALVVALTSSSAVRFGMAILKEQEAGIS